ncbi:hypothetical protein SCLCIDRAFT_1223622 [Scleroderma citrinum Foug A]|uniref:Uncharacterized protein n=1 Tax=Scleroderma citrinum Foug A TaxID=1036808 RepID=A0A0C3D841_9AGAM|nr:hypothetical protein SCLCIDRAFT_1223622 [Scleroderma citrinum Foug A]
MNKSDGRFSVRRSTVLRLAKVPDHPTIESQAMEMLSSQLPTYCHGSLQTSKRTEQGQVVPGDFLRMSPCLQRTADAHSNATFTPFLRELGNFTPGVDSRPMGTYIV